MFRPYTIALFKREIFEFCTSKSLENVLTDKNHALKYLMKKSKQSYVYPIMF
jgi:hypothetical protein